LSPGDNVLIRAASQAPEPLPENMNGPADHYCLHDRWKPPIQLEEEQAIAVRELDPTAHLALKHHQLTSKRGGILGFESADRPELRNQQPQKEEEQRDSFIRSNGRGFRHTQVAA
jgi:hypothetical protein